MATRSPTPSRREESLSRERIIKASIELLDSGGEDGLTFRALSERLVTGPGAIYWHIANKDDLLTAACDAIVANALRGCAIGANPAAAIRSLALGIFDAMDEHPWVGSALAHAPAQMPVLRVLEGLGQQVRALGVLDDDQWTVVAALLSYILGVSGQNAAHRQIARVHNLDRSHFLEAVATAWSQLDPQEFPFARSIAARVPTHDDRADFLAGIDFILRGIGASPA